MQLLPRFSLRSTLLAVVVVALLALFLREAVVGKVWAQSVSVALASIFVVLVGHVLFFAVVRGFAALGGISNTAPTVEPLVIRKSTTASPTNEE